MCHQKGTLSSLSPPSTYFFHKIYSWPRQDCRPWRHSWCFWEPLLSFAPWCRDLCVPSIFCCPWIVILLRLPLAPGAQSPPALPSHPSAQWQEAWETLPLCFQVWRWGHTPASIGGYWFAHFFGSFKCWKGPRVALTGVSPPVGDTAPISLLLHVNSVTDAFMGSAHKWRALDRLVRSCDLLPVICWTILLFFFFFSNLRSEVFIWLLPS